MKKLIAKIFGQKKCTQDFEIINVNSILLKPIGDAVGDSIVHLSHLSQIKKAFPHIKIGVFVTNRNRAIYQNSTIVDVLIEDIPKSYILQRYKWDLYLDFLPSFTTKSIILDYILHAKYVINFGKRTKKFYNLDTIKNHDFAVQVPELVHFKDYLMYSPFSKDLSPVLNYQIEIPKIAQEKVASFWQSEGCVKVLLNPQGSTRHLPEQELADLLLRIDRNNVEFLMTNTQGSEAYFKQLPMIENMKLAPKTSLFEYFALINSADIVIAVDGGGVHIACACQRKLLAFYSNNQSNLHKWSPISLNENDILTLVGNDISRDSNSTYGFDLDKASRWLNRQIGECK